MAARLTSQTVAQHEEATDGIPRPEAPRVLRDAPHPEEAAKRAVSKGAPRHEDEASKDALRSSSTPAFAGMKYPVDRTCFTLGRAAQAGFGLFSASRRCMKSVSRVTISWSSSTTQRTPASSSPTMVEY